MDFFSFFRPPTEEEAAAMQEAHDRHHMAIEDFKHASQRLFDELDEDQLKTMMSMLHILNSRSGDSLASLWEGIAAATLKHRFGICITCGVNHDTELQTPTANEEAYRKLVGDETAGDEDQPFPIFSITPEQRKLMEEYHLDDVYDEDTWQFKYFACTGIKGSRGPCGATYPSIEDRMQKGPEECSGCFQRAMHG